MLQSTNMQKGIQVSNSQSDIVNSTQNLLNVHIYFKTHQLTVKQDNYRQQNYKAMKLKIQIITFTTQNFIDALKWRGRHKGDGQKCR